MADGQNDGTVQLEVVLGAMHQSYIALYHALVNSGALARGEVSAVLRASMKHDGPMQCEDLFYQLEGIIAALDRIDNGGRPLFRVVE